MESVEKATGAIPEPMPAEPPEDPAADQPVSETDADVPVSPAGDEAPQAWDELVSTGLSFLGIGIEAPTAAWGSMINDGRNYLLRLPVLSFAPGAAIMLVVFSFNMVGDGLRDALDPRLRGVW